MLCIRCCLVCTLHKPFETRHINSTIIPKRSLSDPPSPSRLFSRDKCKIMEFQNLNDQLPVLKAIRFKSRDILDSQCRLSVTVILTIIYQSQKCPPPLQRSLSDTLCSCHKTLRKQFHRFMYPSWRETSDGISLKYDIENSDLNQ